MFDSCFTIPVSASMQKGPRRSTLEFPGTQKAPKKNETETKRHQEFTEIVGEGMDIQARMVDRLDKKIDVLAGEFCKDSVICGEKNIFRDFLSFQITCLTYVQTSLDCRGRSIQ